MENFVKAGKNFLRIAIPIIFVAGALISLYNTNPAKYRALIPGLGEMFPADAEAALIDRLQSINGASNINYVVSSTQHASSPARHWNPMVNRAVDMWCVVVSPPSEIRVIDDGDRQLRSFLVYRTEQNSRWLITDGIAVFHTDRAEFESVGCTNYQH